MMYLEYYIIYYIKKKPLKLPKNERLFHKADGTKLQSWSLTTMDNLQELKFELLSHPAYSQ